MSEMETEKSAQESSKEELRRQLYASLRSTGVLDSMKGQLRARLLEHLRHHKEDLIQPKKKQRKPSLIERLLSSLFLDYLESNGFTFTVSVFMPESQMASWPPFSYQEMLELLHLGPTSDLHVRLKLGGEGRECLAHQLVTVLQQMADRNSIQEVSTQTSPAEACKRAMRTSCTSPRQLERSLKEVEDAYIRKKEAHEAQRALPHHSLEDKLTVLHQEFDARVNAEVALQVCRIRDYEINAARMDEAARYRRQLARDREELEDMHKSRMDRVKAREESLLERMLSKEKAIESSAYEQRQKILLEITSLREREIKLRQLKESQERREEKLDERELQLRAKEEEVGLERKALYVQADEIAASRRKELEEQYKELCDRLHHDQTLLAAEREQLKDEKVAMAIALAASRSDKELIQALHRRLSVEEDQRLKLEMSIRELEEKLKQQTSPAPALANTREQRLEEQLRESQAGLEQERLQRQAIEKEKKTLERKLQQKKVELAAARSPQGEWITEHKNLMATIYKQEAELHQKETKLQLMEAEKEKLTNRHMKLLLKIDHLDTLVKKAQEEKDHLVHDFEELQVQQTTIERELLETTTLLRKAQQALEAERLEHCALRSHMNAVVPYTRNDLSNATPERHCGSQDKIEHSSGLVDQKSGVVVSFGKTKESFQQKSKPEAHELWTRLLSDNAAKRASLDQDLERSHILNSSTSKPFPSGNGEGKSSNSNDINDLKAIPFEKLRTGKGGITMVTKTEALTETLVDGPVEGFTSSCDQEKFAKHSYEDDIPSRRTSYLTELSKPTRWNNDYKDSMSSVQGLATEFQCSRSEVCIGDCSSGNDPIFKWNKTHFEEGGEMTEECEKELLRDEQGAEMTLEFRSASMLEIMSPIANLPKPEISGTQGDLRVFPNLSRSEGNEDDANRDGGGDLSVHGITAVARTAQEEDEHVERYGAEGLWSPYLGESEKHSRHDSEADEGLNQDSFSCKYVSSLKHDLESLASTQSKDEIHMGSSCGPQMDSHSESDLTPVGSAINLVHNRPPMIPVPKDSRLLNISPGNHVDNRDHQSGELQEEIKDNRHLPRNEIECQILKEVREMQGDRSTAEVAGNEVREVDAAESELLSNDTQKLMNLRDEVNKVGLDISYITAESEDGVAHNSNKDLSRLMSMLGLTMTTTKDQDKGSYKEEEVPNEVLNLSQVGSHQDESRTLQNENDARACGRMTGLPEIGEMLCKQEIHSVRERAQRDLQSCSVQDCTTKGQSERVEVKDDREVLMFDPQQFSKSPDYGAHALQTLRSSIVIRKQEVAVNKETEKESPKSHPTLTLAIRDNQLVKLGKEDEFQGGERSTSALDPSRSEEILMDTKSSDESMVRKETLNMIDERSYMHQARSPAHDQASHAGTDSSGEESAYKGDSFEEDEDEEEEHIDEKPAYSEGSCTNAGMTMQTARIPGLNDLSMKEHLCPQSKPNIKGNQSRSLDGSSENWEGQSEQGSYSPEGDGATTDFFYEHK
ncbi:hypothetical protein KC19_11G124600 [Ceratodon purpureus]|uniref:LisH domain-containing protein n=1 Tax=Ceratodon purpureus TaxID=3225 RepID=A0A8T0GD84_CERPU|nr:hypothetical protein KC19_11G124600 [Ceratodon purpureus]